MGANPPKTYVEDVFSTYLTTGTGAGQTITTGIDGATHNVLSWSKSRSATTGHRLVDTVRGATKELITDGTDAESTATQGVKSFSSTGIVLGTDTDYNNNLATYIHWQFREANKFFKIVQAVKN